jgi:hypothetical protein
VKSRKKAAQSVVGSLPARIKPSNLPSLNEALAYLFHELGKASELHQTDGNAGREGTIHSVETLLKFLSLFAPVISSRLHAPLAVLFDALMSLDDGKVLPLLKPTNKNGRTRASALRGSLIGAAAFTVRRLTETGMLAPTAHEAVAHKLKGIGVTPARGRGRLTARTVRGWCQEVRTDIGRHGESAQTYDELIAVDDTNGLPPQQSRTVLLNRLAEAAKKVRAHEGA